MSKYLQLGGILSVMALIAAPPSTHANGKPEAPRILVQPKPAPPQQPSVQAFKTTQPVGSTAKSTGKPAVDQILCVAGCNTMQPVVVQERPHVPHVESSHPKWREYSWDIACADGIGCRARNVLPLPRRCWRSSTIYVVHRPYRD